MEPAAQPLAKRQRKEPAWKSVFVDPSKWKDVKDGIEIPASVSLVDSQLRQPSANASPPGAGEEEEEPVTKVVSTRPLDFNHAEVVVLHKGRQYRGIVERTELPQSVGVATQVGCTRLQGVGELQ